MNHYLNQNHYYLSKTWIVISSVLLILFMLLSVNIVLPMKWQFPAWKLSSHLSSVRTNTVDGTRTDYLNGMGVLTVALDKNYATVVRTLDSNGNCVLERYFDNHGKPTVSINGNSALRREYNEAGQWVCSTSLDSTLRPVTGRSRYASIHRTYNANGKVETEMYYSADGLPAIDHYKKYGIRYEYNENNKISVITNLDAAGNPMINSDHYAVSKRTYASDGKLHTEMFYDEHGNPAKLGDGQYGYVYENGRPVCVDQNGRKIFVLRHFLLNTIFIVLLIGVILLLLILFSDSMLTWILLLLYLSFIAYMTIINRETGSSVVTWYIPPNYYLFFKDSEILANIWLFIPLGAILYKLSHIWEIISLPIALSLAIETSQLFFDIGAFELSDIIANSLGGVMGVIICFLLEPPAARIWSKLRTRPL